ncbi:MAG: hypothetical protein M3440_00895 [Chloroflexota bacterium]|nr:hypothetical protein [Chloroflexota bacterium]
MTGRRNPLDRFFLGVYVTLVAVGIYLGHGRDIAMVALQVVGILAFLFGGLVILVVIEEGAKWTNAKFMDWWETTVIPWWDKVGD